MKTLARKPFGRSYWVVPNKFLAGAYPGSKDLLEAEEKISGLVTCGIRHVINLMEEEETKYGNERFVPYEEVLGTVSAQSGVTVGVTRYPIRDLNVPSEKEMIQILDTIDESIAEALPVYVHCWGGVGGTGTVVGCYLIRHGLATREDVLDRISVLRRDEVTAYRPSPEILEQRKMVQFWRLGR
jgi:protein tyrosine phosphatase